MGRTWPLVGRRDELQRLATALLDDGVAAAVLVGDSGVGKTRLAAECLQLGADAGYARARVIATRAASEIPLGALAPLLPDFGSKQVNLLAAAREALAAVADGRPLLLFVDDAHLLDSASAALLLTIAAERRAFVLATLRTGEAPPDAVVALWKDGLAIRVDLDRLRPEDVDLLASEVLGGPVEPGLAAELRRLSGGNALALRELVLGGLEAGAIAERSGRWALAAALPVSNRLVELVAARLQALSASEQEALGLVALGEPLSVRLLTGLTDPVAVESLEGQRLVDVRRDGNRNEVWLAHPLEGEILRDRLSAVRRHRLVARLADALDGTGARRRGDRLRLASWRLDVGDLADGELLVAAARRSFLSGDREGTVRFASAAWRAHRHVAAGHLLGHSLCADGHYDEAAEVLTAALARADDDRDRGLVAIALSEDLFRAGHVEEAFAVARSVEADLAEGDWRAELVGHRATLMMLRGDLTSALDEVRPMLEGDADRPYVEAAIVAGAVLAADGRPLDAVEISSKAYDIHQRIWEHDLFQSDPGVHLFIRVLGLVEAGKLDEAEQIAAAGFALTEAGSSGSEHAGFALERGIVATEQGRLRTALEWYQRAGELYATHGPPGRRRLAVPGVLLAAAQLGELAVARSARRELVSERQPVVEFARPGALMGEAWLLLAEGRTEHALAVLDDAYELGMDRGARSASCAALHAMARMGRPERAQERAERLAPDLQGPLLGARVVHIRAAAAGDGRDLEQVGAAFAALGAHLYAAEAWADAARAHRRAGRSRDADAAARRSTALAAACEGVRTPGLRLAVELRPLTPREREIAVLAASGLPTPSIAERLDLSPRTVSNHLQRAYEKLGVSSRDDLGSALDGGA